MNNSEINNQPNNAFLLSTFDYNNLPQSALPERLDVLLEQVGKVFNANVDNHLGNDETKSFIWTVKILNYPNSNNHFDNITLGITELGMETGLDTNLTTHSRVDSQAQSFLQLNYKITVTKSTESKKN